MFVYVLTYFNVSVKYQTAIYSLLIIATSVLSVFIVNEDLMSGLALQIWNSLSLGKTVSLLAFFFLGVLVKMHWAVCSAIMESKKFLVCTLLIFTVLSILSPGPETNDSIVYYSSRFAGLAFMISLAMNLRDILESDNPVCRYFRHIGRNTLSIYLLHFLFFC